MIIDLILVIVVIFIWLGVVTQVIIPACKGGLLFPVFRRQAQLETTLIELNQQESDLELINKIKHQNEQLAEKVNQSTKKESENE